MHEQDREALAEITIAAQTSQSLSNAERTHYLALCEHLSAVDPKTDLPRVHPKTAKKYASVLRKMLLSHEEYGMAAGTDCLAPGSVRGCQTALRQSDTHTKQHGQPLAAYHALLVRALPQA